MRQTRRTSRPANNAMQRAVRRLWLTVFQQQCQVHISEFVNYCHSHNSISPYWEADYLSLSTFAMYAVQNICNCNLTCVKIPAATVAGQENSKIGEMKPVRYWQSSFISHQYIFHIKHLKWKFNPQLCYTMYSGLPLTLGLIWFCLTQYMENRHKFCVTFQKGSNS